MWALLFLGVVWVVSSLLDEARRSQSPLGAIETSDLANVKPPVATIEQRQRIETEFAPYIARLQETKRDYARIRLTPTGDDEPWSSKVGGVPYLPAGATLPVDPDRPEQPMGLLAQIDFAELPALEGYPREGLLQFFLAEDPELRHFGDFRNDRVARQSRQIYFRVVYWPQRAPALGSVPGRLPVATALSLAHGQALRMSFTREKETITPADSSFRSRIGIDPYEFVEKLARELSISEWTVANVLPLASGSGHKVGGWPDFAQDDPRSADSTLRLLLQLDSDEYLMWGDAGVANFFITPEDLAARDFSHVMFNWDSH